MVDIVVIPAAGWGTRFLPATKAIPKEMVPVGDKPVIQYAVEEAARAGIKHVVLISHGAKSALENHFDRNAELEMVLSTRHKDELLLRTKNTLPQGMRLSVVRQGEALGLGHAVACAEQVVGARDFAVMLPDDLLLGTGETLRNMVQRYHQDGVYSIAVEHVALEATRQYGIVALQNAAQEQMPKGQRITGIVEKPEPALAPSRLAVVGRYVLPAAIFSALKTIKPGAGGELQLTDAIAACLNSHTFVSHEFSDQRFDCGSRWGFLAANVFIGMQEPDTAQRLRALINGVPV